MRFIVEHDGRATEFPDDSLLIFIDETGDEKFCDPNVPYFGFGGCVCKASNYTDHIITPWQRVEALFPDDMKPLHSAELRDLNDEQIKALARFFKETNFGRFASIIKQGWENESEHSAFHIAARTTLDRVLDIIKVWKEPFSTIVVFFEHSQRLDALYANYFRRYNFNYEDGRKVPAFYATQRKALGANFASGLVVADFVAHTAGSMSRTTQGGTQKAVRRDFNAIFEHPLGSHLFIDAIRTGERG